jgi:hypothetical protein
MAPKFMDELVKKLREKGLAESSIETYIRNLRTLNGSSDFKSVKFLRDTKAVEDMLATYSQSTAKTMLGAIVSVLAFVKDTAYYRKTYAYYHRRMAEEMEKSKSRDTGEKTDKQKQNWVSWEDVLSTAKRLRGEGGHLDTLVLSLYTEIPPRRNKDFFEMWVSEGEGTDKTRNYCVLEKGRPVKFVFHCFKTAKGMGSQTIPIPSNLADIILLTNPRVGEKLLPFQNENGITRTLNRIFDKKIGASMLRHIYLSSKYGDRRDEMANDARLMGHSIQQQQTTYTQR